MSFQNTYDSLDCDFFSGTKWPEMVNAGSKGFCRRLSTVLSFLTVWKPTQDLGTGDDGIGNTNNIVLVVRYNQKRSVVKTTTLLSDICVHLQQTLQSWANCNPELYFFFLQRRWSGRCPLTPDDNVNGDESSCSLILLLVMTVDIRIESERHVKDLDSIATSWVNNRLSSQQLQFVTTSPSLRLIKEQLQFLRATTLN